MGKLGQLTPWIKWMKNYKAKTCKKQQFSEWVGVGSEGEGRCRERRYADHIFIQIYFRMHHFVVKFSKISSLQAARGH